MTKPLYIYGQSGHGKVLADIAKACGYAPIEFIDDDPQKTGVLRFDDALHVSIPVALGIGHNAIRAQVAQRLLERGFTLETLIHPSAVISPSARIGSGSVVMALCVVNADARIGEGCILNSGCVIEHDCNLSDFVHVSPKAALAGGVRVGEGTQIGIGASVIQNIAIGAHTMIAAGSAVTCNLPSNVMAAGVPARIKTALTQHQGALP
ncbi:MAG: acetyltransferase [Campylobacterales bacterium]|nr:acetyltransferase [Campylobacterales bacterium]